MARGLGTRMRKADGSASLSAAQAAAAATGVKGMISVGRPFLDYVLSALADAGITDVVIVIGPEHHAVREYFERTRPPQRVRVRFAIQEQPIGTANAVVAGAGVVGRQPFLTLNADNYYPVKALEALASFDEAATIAFDREALVELGNIDAERVRNFAILEMADSERLVQIIEKPGATINLDSPRSRWVGMNCWTVTPELVDVCARVPLSSRGEYELPQAVQLALSEGMMVHAVRMSAGVLDLSQRSDIAAVMAHLADVEARP